MRTTQKTSVTRMSYVAVSTEDGASPMPPPSANAENARNTLERRIAVVLEIAFVIFLNAFIIKTPYLRIIASDIFFAVSETTFVVTTTAPATGTADEAAVVAVVAAVVVAACVAPAVVACVAVAEATCTV